MKQLHTRAAQAHGVSLLLRRAAARHRTRAPRPNQIPIPDRPCALRDCRHACVAQTVWLGADSAHAVRATEPSPGLPQISPSSSTSSSRQIPHKSPRASSASGRFDSAMTFTTQLGPVAARMRPSPRTAPWKRRGSQRGAVWDIVRVRTCVCACVPSFARFIRARAKFSVCHDRM